MELIENKVLKVNVPHQIAEEIKGTIHKCKELSRDNDNTSLAIHWGAQEMIALNKIAMFKNDLPSPIAQEYQWTGKFQPFDHQRTTSEFLSVRSRAFCFNEAGTGKTSSILWASDYLMNKGLIKRVLVICPLSIMTSAWKNDIYNTVIHRTPGVAYGTADDRRAIISNERYEYVIINYDGVRIVMDDIIKAKFDLIVVDEANAYKSVSTNRWKTLNKILTPETGLMAHDRHTGISITCRCIRTSKTSQPR